MQVQADLQGNLSSIEPQIQSNYSVVSQKPGSPFNPYDYEARQYGLYGIQILRQEPGRKIKIKTADATISAIDFATNGPFDLNTDARLRLASIEAILDFGAIHTSIAAARAQTGISEQIGDRLSALKGPDSMARIYPTTFAANTGVANGLNQINATAILHPNVHATVQFAVKGAFDSRRIIYSKNTTDVANAFAKTTKRPVVVVEDGLYSMGNFTDFSSLRNFLSESPNGYVWIDDAHSMGLRGVAGRGQAMDEMYTQPERTIITGSFGKAFGAAGGFSVGPKPFMYGLISESVADRFSCNLDLAGQGAILKAMEIFDEASELEAMRTALNSRLALVDKLLSYEHMHTPQEGTPVGFRVISFSTPSEAIAVAGRLLQQYGILTTPVYYPTVAKGQGAIRVSISIGHTEKDIELLVTGLSKK